MKIATGQKWSCSPREAGGSTCVFTVVAIDPANGETHLRAEDHDQAQSCLSYLFYDKRQDKHVPTLEMRFYPENSFKGDEAWKNGLYACNKAWGLWDRMTLVQ